MVSRPYENDHCSTPGLTVVDSELRPDGTFVLVLKGKRRIVEDRRQKPEPRPEGV